MKHFAGYHRVYKYQLDEDVVLGTDVRGYAAIVPSVDGENPWVSLSVDGTLHVRAGYSWDGASGPTVDTPDTMIPALAHDALYQLMGIGALPSGLRRSADVLFRHLLRDNGVSFVRRNIWYAAVRLFGGLFLRP